MADDLDIRRGGVIAVDTVTLRRTADEITTLSTRIGSAAAGLRTAGGMLHSAGAMAHGEPDAGARALAGVADRIVADACNLAANLRATAGVYETIELRAARAVAAAAGDHAELARIDARLAELSADHPLSRLRARWDEWAWRLAAPLDLFGQAWWGGQALGPAMSAGPLAIAGAGSTLVALLGLGTVPAAAQLKGTPDPVVVHPLSPPMATVAPDGLASAARRMPGGDDARVRVERYTMRDGSRRFAIYVAGTQGGAHEPFDWNSNKQLYLGERSASYGAAVEALRRSGAEPGDEVLAVGHSQGAMVAERLALEGEYDVSTLVTFGSPIEAEVPASTLSVNVRHTDDPVAALADHGSPAGIGAPGSFVAERLADPLPGVHDLDLPAHHLETYAETAALLDASSDPRMDPVREVFAQLADAASVDVVEYAAVRPAS